VALSKKKIKICFAASSGGHLEQILMLRPLMERYDSFLVTEKTPYSIGAKELRCYYLPQINRKEWNCVPRLVVNGFQSLWIYLTEQPDIVISIGALGTLPLCLLCKLTGKKLVFIESFAKVTSPTLTGKFLYRYADRFYVQWPQMHRFYRKAICLGGIY